MRSPPWRASPSPPAPSERRCSSGLRSPRRSRCSDSSSRSSSPAEGGVVRKRIRALIAVVGIVGVVSFVAAPAFAQETTPKYASEADKQCAEKLAKGGSVDDCQKAPSPLLPGRDEIIWGSLAFLVLLGAMWKFGVPAVKNMEQAREDRIRNDLE